MAMGTVQFMVCLPNASHSRLVSNSHGLSLWRCSQRLPTQGSTGHETGHISSSKTWLSRKGLPVESSAMAMGTVQFMVCLPNASHSQLVSNSHDITLWRCSQRLPTKGSTGHRTGHIPKSKDWTFGNEIADRQCEAHGKRNLMHTLQRSDHIVKPAELHQGNGCLTRVGFVTTCSALALWTSAPNGLAAELGPISSDTLLTVELLPRFVSVLGDLDAGTAQLATSFVGPFISIFNLLFIFRIVMSWYPGIPVKRFPFFLVYNPTEPVLGPTRRLIQPVGGVDVAPVIWVALMSFANEILLGKQGLLVLLSQQQS